MWKLLETADVFLDGTSAHVLERLGLDATTVRVRLRSIVYAKRDLTTGTSVRRRDRAGYDIGASGLAGRGRDARAVLRRPADDPQRLRRPHDGSRRCWPARSVRLLERAATGEGRLVQASLLGTGLDPWVRISRSCRASADRRPSRVRSRPLHSSTAPSRLTATGSGCLGLEGDRHWPGFSAAIVCFDLGEDERFATLVGRREHAPRRSPSSTTPSMPAHAPSGSSGRRVQGVVGTCQHAARRARRSAGNAAGMFVDMAGFDGERYRSVATDPFPSVHRSRRRARSSADAGRAHRRSPVRGRPLRAPSPSGRSARRRAALAADEEVGEPRVWAVEISSTRAADVEAGGDRDRLWVAALS